MRNDSALSKCIEANNRPMSANEVSEWVATHYDLPLAQATNNVSATGRKGAASAFGQKIRRRLRAMTLTDKSRHEYYIDNHVTAVFAKPLEPVVGVAPTPPIGAGMEALLDSIAEVAGGAPVVQYPKPRITIDEATGSVTIETAGLIIEVRPAHGR